MDVARLESASAPLVVPSTGLPTCAIPTVPLNAAGHRAHPMPVGATLDQRIAWHLEHAAACGCRPIAGKLAEEMRARGVRARPPRRA